MKKTLALTLAILMAFAMLLSFAACGGTDDAEETTAPAKTELVTASVYGLSFKVPADFTEFTEKQPGAKSANKGAGASIAVTDIIDASELPFDSWTEENYISDTLAGTTDAKILEFSKDKKVSGYDALYVHYTTKSQSGRELEGYNYVIYYPLQDGGTGYQSITFAMVKSVESSLTANITEVLESLSAE